MTRLRYTVGGTGHMKSSDTVDLEMEMLPLGALARAAVDTLSTEIEIEVSGVKMHLAGWEDPDHWESDWAELLGCDPDDVGERISELLGRAVES